MATATAVEISTGEHDALSPAEQEAWRAMLRAHGALAKRIDASLEQAHHLPMSSYEVLQRLHETGEERMRMCDLAERAQLSRSGLTRLVDRLEREGLIERCSCKHDARGAYACLTERGRERLEQARATHLALVREHFLARFSEEELEVLTAMLERVAPCVPARL